MITCLKDLKPKHTTQNFIFQLQDFLLTIEDKHIPIYGQDRCFHQFMAADSKLFSQFGLKIFAAIIVRASIHCTSHRKDFPVAKVDCKAKCRTVSEPSKAKITSS